ncbi:hypothetical protein HK096_010742, partial [Nowakowskiella sp. JEL0078]
MSKKGNPSMVTSDQELSRCNSLDHLFDSNQNITEIMSQSHMNPNDLFSENLSINYKNNHYNPYLNSHLKGCECTGCHDTWSSPQSNKYNHTKPSTYPTPRFKNLRFPEIDLHSQTASLFSTTQVFDSANNISAPVSPACLNMTQKQNFDHKLAILNPSSSLAVSQQHTSSEWSHIETSVSKWPIQQGGENLMLRTKWSADNRDYKHDIYMDEEDEVVANHRDVG